jgi:hypothetical protein
MTDRPIEKSIVILGIGSGDTQWELVLGPIWGSIFQQSTFASPLLATLLSRKSATIFGQRTIPEPSTPHIGREVELVAQTAAFVYI